MPDVTDLLTDDRPAFAELPEPERVLLWSMRVWVIGHCRQQSVSARIAAALGAHGLEHALPELDAFMGALSRGASRPIELLCLCRAEVSDDERLLLDAFALCQQDEADDAQTALCTFLTEHAATYAVRKAEAVALDFLDAGASLPWNVEHQGRRVAITQPLVLH